VAHGLGGIDSLIYTNSLEAFELNYRRGFRVFEADLGVSSDGHVVAVHDWATPSRLPGIVGQPTLDRFRNARVYGRFTPLEASSLVLLLARYRDARVLLDFKADPATILRALSNATTDTTVLDRLIPIVRQGSDAGRMRAFYPFPSVVWTLHWVQSSDAEIIRDMSRFGIGVVITNRFRISPSVASIS
jgi:glycerophosphoryl diester phosphodiesterase